MPTATTPTTRRWSSCDAATGEEPIAIVPLMHRHEVEPTDAATHTTMRHGADLALTPVPPTATAILFGASYHADYATILTDPDDLPAVAKAVAAYLAGPAMGDVGRRRSATSPLRRPDGRRAGGRVRGARDGAGWTLNVEREDVCPVATLPRRRRHRDYLATLGKKVRHEIRRKVRRAEALGEDRASIESTDPLADLEVFIDLHQRRWGDDGLFPPTRRAATRAASSSDACSSFSRSDGPLALSFLWVGDRRIAAGHPFRDSRRAAVLQRRDRS